jgi:hypothetical protein
MSNFNVDDEIKRLHEMKQICQNYIQDSETENNVLVQTRVLLKEIKLRLSHFCHHDVICDIIEVGETVKTVYYCVKCEANF